MRTYPNMYDVLKASYKNNHEQATSLSRFSYNRDEELSNDNQQAYFNPEKKKLIYTVTGTHNAKDWGTNAYLAVRKIKDTNRYESADAGLKKAKKNRNSRLLGHVNFDGQKYCFVKKKVINTDLFPDLDIKATP